MANGNSDIDRLVWPDGAKKFQWIDRAKAIMDFATRAGTMYLGYQAFEKIAPGAGLSGAIVSQIAMRLATSNNLAAGAAGVATLTGMGILNVLDPNVNYAKGAQDWIAGATAPFGVSDYGVAAYELMFPGRRMYGVAPPGTPAGPYHGERQMQP